MGKLIIGQEVTFPHMGHARGGKIVAIEQNALGEDVAVIAADGGYEIRYAMNALYAKTDMRAEARRLEAEREALERGIAMSRVSIPPAQPPNA